LPRKSHRILTWLNAGGAVPATVPADFDRQDDMDFPIKRRSLTVNGVRTSISLEEPFWLRLNEIARDRALSVGQLVHQIDLGRRHSNLSAAIWQLVAEECHRRLTALQQQRRDRE
jgi:predicted DNA-binding ribbon-helix-helix protein